MDFVLTLLGVNGATPAHGRFPTSQVFQVHHHYMMVDCGEGAQMRMSDFDIPKNRISRIFISHLHGDHVFGLPGLLFSYSLNERQAPLTIYSPPGLEAMIHALLLPGGKMSYPLHFIEFDPFHSNVIFENEVLFVQTIPLKHRIPTAGFLFKELPFEKNIRKDKIAELNLTIPQIRSIKEGKDLLLDDGTLIPNDELTLPPYLPRAYAYVSDTQYSEEIIPLIEGADLLYHETTFCKDQEENAGTTMHSTAEQAAHIALKAGVGKLITGHYSSRYADPLPLFEEAKAVFKNTEMGREGVSYEVNRKRALND